MLFKKDLVVTPRIQDDSDFGTSVTVGTTKLYVNTDSIVSVHCRCKTVFPSQNRHPIKHKS